MPAEDRRHWWDFHYSRTGSSDAPLVPSRAAGGCSDDAHWLLAELRTCASVHDILELGCGLGYTAELLHNAGYRVHATDISPVALRTLRERAPAVTTTELDHARPFPFADATYDAVVAELSLHYFAAEVTRAIVAEIARVLRPAGVLVARVNSILDTSFGAGVGREVEPDLYEHNGHYKRFFDEPTLRLLLSDWRDLRIRHLTTDRFGPEKRLYQIVARRPSAKRGTTHR